MVVFIIMLIQQGRKQAIYTMSALSRRPTGGWISHSFERGSSPPTSDDGTLPDGIYSELVGGGKTVVVYGSAGTGKTWFATHMLKMLRDKKAFEFSFFINAKNISKEGVNSGQTFAQYLTKENQLESADQAKFLQIMEDKPQQIAFIFDCVDELPSHKNNAYLHQLLTEPVPGARLLLSRHPHPEINIAVQIKLAGFNSFENVLEFMKYQLSNVYKITSKTPQLVLYLKTHPIIGELCIIPRMAAILAALYAADNKVIKDTETMVVSKMVLGWVEMALEITGVKSLYKLPADKKEHLLHIAQIAYHSLMYSKNGSFSLDPTEVSYVNLQEGYSSLEDVNNFDLIQCRGNSVQSFLSCVIQEFLAAFYLSYLPQDEQIAFYYETFPKNIRQLQNVCLFHFGLTRLETEAFLNSSKLIVAGMIESMGHVAMKLEGSLYLDLQKLIQACLYEAQDPTLVKTFTQQYTKLMKITFPDVRALDDGRLTTQLTYVILQSGIKLWEIEIPNENARGKTDAIVFPISMAETSIKVAVKVQPNPNSTVTVTAFFNERLSRPTGRATDMIPRGKSEEERELYFQHAMKCTGRRETLHRVAQLYSPVPVKSDAADPAFASLIACECVEQKFMEEVVIEPIHPIHTVQLSSKSRKAKMADGERDATARKHVEKKHQNNYMEIIVLNKPSVKSITFQPPGGVQQCRLVMSGEKLSSPMSGRIAMEVEAEKLLDHFVTCVQADDGGTATKMICHGLPLPKSKTKLEADKANTVQSEEVTAETRVHDDTLRVPVTAAQVAPSHKNFQDADITLFSPVPTQAESSEKITWRPGMIMFTVSLMIIIVLYCMMATFIPLHDLLL